MGLIFGLAVSLIAQSAFDVKKKQKTSINKSAFGTVQIQGHPSMRMGSGSLKSSKPTFKQHLAFPQSLLQQREEKVFYSSETGLPSFITTKNNDGGSRLSVKKDHQTATFDYLSELKSILKLERPESDFVVQHMKQDNSNKTRVRLAQQYQGVPIYGAEVIVHLNEFGQGESFNGTYYRIVEKIDPNPTISERNAIDRVDAHLGKGVGLRPLNNLEKKLVQHEQPKATLCIYQDNGLVRTNVLAYHVVYCPSIQERWEYLIDASNGAVLHHFQSACSVDGPRTATGPDLNGVSRTVNTYQVGATYYMVDTSRPMYQAAGSSLPDEPVGGILTVDMNNTFGDDQTIQHATSGNNVWGTATQIKALSAHFNAGVAYEYFRTKHNRNSIDGVGGTVYSVVNVSDPESGEALDNAFWNGKVMYYGNGDIGFKPLAGALDVAGHEMTHGVVQGTANLEYQGESGAINESMADIFGTMMDPADWLIGEDVVKLAAFPSGALRSLSDPHNGGTNFSSPGYQPRHKNEAYTGTEDNGGVHINSGIPNHAFFKYAEAITRDKAAAVFYKALDDYLTKSSQFIDLRLAVIKAAGDLFGAASNEATQAGLAFDAVGITTGQPGEYTETLPDNPGTEFMLVYNMDGADPNTLYRTTLDGTSPTALTTTDFVSRPSVTDKGDVAVFVASDNTIHLITTSPGSTPTEIILDDQPIWSNVVISKGGTKIAAVTTAQQPVIYVFDFESEQLGEFELYNPTYSESVNSAGPVFADALEWDYTGEYLVYDCFNRINNASGADIEYWDVNFIHVWDNDARDFAGGTIEKLFSSLPDGVSIGNPSFAKNSPYIIAFDYVDEVEAEYSILGCNIETNDVNVIAENNTLGWPSFNKDDTHLAFTALDGPDYTANDIVLNSDKISSSTVAITKYTSAKWPVYFATGEREIGDEVITGVLDESTTKVALNCFPNPFTHNVSVQLTEPLMSGSRVEVVNSIGQKVYESVTSYPTEGAVEMDLDNLRPGRYIIRISGGKKTGGCKIVKK
jgi:Zn-dependent metalloprotease